MKARKGEEGKGPIKARKGNEGRWQKKEEKAYGGEGEYVRTQENDLLAEFG